MVIDADDFLLVGGQFLGVALMGRLVVGNLEGSSIAL